MAQHWSERARLGVVEVGGALHVALRDQHHPARHAVGHVDVTDVPVLVLEERSAGGERGARRSQDPCAPPIAEGVAEAARLQAERTAPIGIQ